MTKLRIELMAIRNALQSLIDKDDDSEVIKLDDLVADINNILFNAKNDSFSAFDLIQKSKEYLVATTNNDEDSIHVFGRSTDSFDLELAMGVLARVRKNIKEEAMYMLFMKMMAGDYDDDK